MRALWLLVLIGCGGGDAHRGTPPNLGRPAPLPGACVDPAADAAKRLAGTDAGAPDGDTPHPTTLADLDSDGTADRAFSAGSPAITRTAVYVMRGACGHYVGDVVAPPQAPAGERPTNGLLDLTVLDGQHCEGARCGCEPTRRVFRFDGTEYREDKAATVEGHEKPCPDGDG